MSEPLVAVCMATYEPPEGLFERQVESLRAQTYTNWVCLIHDDGSTAGATERIRQVIAGDGRFVFAQNAERVGFYRNFERCLRRVPQGAAFVALADQDDYWYADKLEALLARFEPGVSLVYSDMRLVDEAGKRLADTFWTRRRNQYTDLTSLLVANTVTGAAAMFRRELLEYLLPFPEAAGPTYHDHWVACAALALGEIRYVERPLYDYVRHSANVTQLPQVTGPLSLIFRLKRRFSLKTWRAWYELTSDILRRVLLFAETIEERCGGRAEAGRLQELRRLTRGNVSAAQLQTVYPYDHLLCYRLLLRAGLSYLRPAPSRRSGPVRNLGKV
jgi:glycosyltransferase involved in cell wall biosynthesis